ncbi:MAG: efflux RND transporter periplasmic adaptor subunit [Spirochaetaceae bacterium]|jgi:multidrug efflux pump subunit AcrA (membrane-fusion protein)|nr:efflux RND transporter periplasmic adaptor subunit [Spirochaetaceae bacterium]
MKNRSFLCISGALALVFLCFLLASCGGKKPGGPMQNVPVFAVNTSTAAQGQIWDYIALSGDIIAGSTVDVYSDVAGKITRVYVEVGRRVSRGTPIAAVDPSKPGMNFIPGVASAPIAGTIIALPAQIGATVSQAVPLARISGTSALEIKLHVAERFISKVAMNQLCEISLDAWPGEVFRGTVTEISPVVDAASRTMEVKVNVTNQGDKLKEGMFAKVKLITTQRENIVKIPASALIQRFGESYVFVVEELEPEAAPSAEQPAEKKGFFASLFGKKEEANDAAAPETPPAKLYEAKKRIVKPGILIDGVLEIMDGLKPGEEFIIKGQTLLNDGARVNVIERVAPLNAER